MELDLLGVRRLDAERDAQVGVDSGILLRQECCWPRGRRRRASQEPAGSGAAATRSGSRPAKHMLFISGSPLLVESGPRYETPRCFSSARSFDGAVRLPLLAGGGHRFGDAAQVPHQGDDLVRPEGGQKPFPHRLALPPQSPEDLSPLRRQRHGERPAVGGVSVPGDEAAALQQQEHRPHRVGVRADPPDQLLLSHGVRVREGGKQHELVGRHPVPGQAGVGPAVEGQIGGPDRPGDLTARCHDDPVGFTYT